MVVLRLRVVWTFRERLKPRNVKSRLKLPGRPAHLPPLENGGSDVVLKALKRESTLALVPRQESV